MASGLTQAFLSLGVEPDFGEIPEEGKVMDDSKIKLLIKELNTYEYSVDEVEWTDPKYNHQN